MENIAMKKFTYDHASSYKGRGKSLASSRVARAQRASEKRHVSRMDEVAKRRRMPLTSIADENVVDVQDKETNDCAKENTSQAQLSRKEKLLKWREERKLKTVNTRKEKKSFVVGHVKYDQESSLFAVKKSSLVVTEKCGSLITKQNKLGTNFNNSAKRVTRASARIAQQSSNTVSKPSNLAVKQTKSKDTEKQKEKLALHQGKSAKTTRQSARSKAAASKGSYPSAKATQKAKDTVMTRSQSKTLQDDSLCQSSSSELEEISDTVKTLNPVHQSEEPTFPSFDNIKNTVSIGRGSAEGVKRNQMSTQAEIRSFAPPDFKFKAPEGVNTFTYFSKTFKFNPLSPNSAAKFMFPSPSSLFTQEKPSDICTHGGYCQAEKCPSFCLNVENNPKEGKHGEEEPSKGDHEICDSSSLQVQGNGSKTVLDGHHNPLSSENKEDTGIEMHSNLEEYSKEDIQGDTSSEHHDAMYFRGLVKKESERLNEICAKWEKINDEEPDLKEEDRGQIRTTIGQAQLLIDQRFHQFSGLIDLSEDRQAEKQATASDLQGFWDMIYFQVEDVSAKFDALEKRKANNWKEEVKKVKKAARKAVKKPLSGEDSNAARKESTKAAANKNRIQQMRMAMKAKMAAERAKLKSEKAHEEEETFVTILTPVKRSKQDDGTEEVVLTPVRRSTRKTPQRLSSCKRTPVVVTTPKKISDSSPGLRLTPDMALGSHNDEAVFCITEASAEIQEVASEEKMDCEVDYQPHPTLKSAGKSRKTPGKVTFQSSMDVDGDYKCTPDVAPTVTDAECGSEAERSLNEAGPVGKKKKSTPPRFLARKCRGRAGTPYNAQRSVKRTSAEVQQGEDVSTDCQTESDEQDSSDAAPRHDSTASLAVAVSSPGSARRRSTRRTPSKYRGTSPPDAPSNGQGKTPTDVSVKLFCEKESERKSEMNAVEMGNFSKYLCPSFSDEDEEKTAPVSSEIGAEDTFVSEQVESNESAPKVNQTKLTPKEHSAKPAATASEPRPGRTPIHLLQYLSDMDTPSPNSRQITPMPKTTLYISPSGTAKTPGLECSSGLASPENVVCRFPGESEAAALVRFTPVAGKEGQSFPTPPVEVPKLKLDDSPGNSEKRRDSVFFAPSYAAAVKAKDNLMSFSPVVEVNEEAQE